MMSYALKMLIGNRTQCLGIVFGIFLATLLISQQSAIFLGLLSRSYRMVTDIPTPNVWIADKATENEEKLRYLPENDIERVRSIPGIAWAMPLAIAILPVITGSGIFEVAKLYGIDDATLIGAPEHMIAGDIEDLRQSYGVIVDDYSARTILAKKQSDGRTVPLEIGDTLEINRKHAVVIGLCHITQGFYPQPIIYTTFSRFLDFSGMVSAPVAFIMAKTVPKANVNDVIGDINALEGLKGYTRDQLSDVIIESFLKTGILINFGLSVLLGIIIGFSITGQIFYGMIVDNITYYALIKAVGGSNAMILSMIVLQAIVVGTIGFLLGMGATILWSFAVADTTLAYLMPWQLVVFTAAVIFFILLVTSWLSIRRVLHVDPKILMGT